MLGKQKAVYVAKRAEANVGRQADNSGRIHSSDSYRPLRLGYSSSFLARQQADYIRIQGLDNYTIGRYNRRPSKETRRLLEQGYRYSTLARR